MSGSITFNPFATNQPTDSFLLQTQGYTQGFAFDDPAVRMELERGVLAAAETIVMWGGVPITEYINVAGAKADGLGPTVARATSQALVTGFSVFNQANSMVVGPGLTVPVSGNGGYVAQFRLFSDARIAVQADPALVSAITATSSIGSQVLYWDVTNYRITLVTTGGNFALPTQVKLISTNSNSKIVSYNSGTKAVTWTTGNAAIIQI